MTSQTSIQRFLRGYSGSGRCVEISSLKTDAWQAYVKYPTYARDITCRLGGWQAQWVATVVMLSGEGKSNGNGMEYLREGFTGDRKAQNQRTTHRACLYLIGLVDIDEPWLRELIPDEKRYDAFMKGDKREFFADIPA